MAWSSSGCRNRLNFTNPKQVRNGSIRVCALRPATSGVFSDQCRTAHVAEAELAARVVKPQHSPVSDESIVDEHKRTARASVCTSKKKTPPKAGFLGFFLGVLPCFHSVKKPSSQMNHASKILQSKPPRISWLTDLQRPHHHGGGQLLTRFGSSHPPKKA